GDPTGRPRWGDCQRGRTQLQCDRRRRRDGSILAGGSAGSVGSRDHRDPQPDQNQRTEGGGKIVSRAAKGRERVAWSSSCSQSVDGMEPDDLLCPRNARPQKALVGRAQWKINQPPSLERERASLEESSAPLLDGRIRTNMGATP